MTDSVAVRNLSAAEVHIAIEWARREGWNPGLSDAACFYAADPNGFFVALNGTEPAAVVSVVRYGESFAFLGLYTCRPDLRGQGYGLRVWSEGMAYAAGRTVGLDGVPDQRPNYARSGFQLAWRNIRYKGVGGGEQVAGVVDLDDVPFSSIVKYDRDVFEADRSHFLRTWIAQPNAVRLGVIQERKLMGWGLLRPCADGFKIGPMLADNAAVAEQLLDGLLAAAPGQPVYFDVPEPNRAAVGAAAARGMTPVFETARMYAGEPPALNLDKIWGITTFELG